MKILMIYFSATGNTAKIARVISRKFTELGAIVDEMDITPGAVRSAGVSFEPYDAIIFGFPIHSWRAPRVVRDWLHTLDGRGKKCSMFFTYGGFHIHPAHHSTRQILEKQGFSVVSSAEFLAAHTFNLGGWKAMEGRPDQTDFNVAAEYASRTYRRFSGEDSDVLGSLEKTDYTDEQLDAIETFRFTVLTQLPTRSGGECSMCRICETSCPSGAINADAGEAEKGKCIGCLGCVSKCPDRILKINDMFESWSSKLKAEKLTEDGMKTKKSRIYL